MRLKSSVIVYHNKKYEVGVIIKKYRKNKMVKYDVILERGVVLCGISMQKNSLCYIDSKKSAIFAVDVNVTDEMIANFTEPEPTTFIHSDY